MPASVAMSGAALGNSAVAIAIAAQAKTDACKSIIKEYNGKTLSVAEQQEYAACIQRVYPQELSQGDVIGIKILIVSAFIGAAIGAYFMRDEDFVGKLIAVFIGFFVCPIGLLMLYGLCKAVQFLFS